jgi:sugar-specific transcriptional regulator TrmB
MNEKRPAMYEPIQEKIIIPESEREIEYHVGSSQNSAADLKEKPKNTNEP